MNQGSVLTTTFYPFEPTNNVTFNSTGSAYGSLVSSEGSTSFVNVASTTVRMPNNITILGIRAGLSASFSGESNTTPDVLFKWLITDSGGSTYDTLNSTTLTAPGTTSTDDTRSGQIVGALTNYTGIQDFDLVLQVASSVTTEKAFAKVKSSTYLSVSYHFNG